jgi:hypothetical protein
MALSDDLAHATKDKTSMFSENNLKETPLATAAKWVSIVQFIYLFSWLILRDSLIL